MRSIRTRTALAAAALALAAGVPATGVYAAAPAPTATAAKSCSAGSTKAKMPNGTKCLRAGEYCSRKRKFQRRYHHYGYHCKTNRRLRKLQR